MKAWDDADTLELKTARADSRESTHLDRLKDTFNVGRMYSSGSGMVPATSLFVLHVLWTSTVVGALHYSCFVIRTFWGKAFWKTASLRFRIEVAT